MEMIPLLLIYGGREGEGGREGGWEGGREGGRKEGGREGEQSRLKATSTK